jgi:hypothetical protein
MIMINGQVPAFIWGRPFTDGTYPVLSFKSGVILLQSDAVRPNQVTVSAPVRRSMLDGVGNLAGLTPPLKLDLPLALEHVELGERLPGLALGAPSFTVTVRGAGSAHVLNIILNAY